MTTLLPTVLVSAVLAAVVAAAIVYLYREKKRGSCCGGCLGCAGQDGCCGGHSPEGKTGDKPRLG